MMLIVWSRLFLTGWQRKNRKTLKCFVVEERLLRYTTTFLQNKSLCSFSEIKRCGGGGGVHAFSLLLLADIPVLHHLFAVGLWAETRMKLHRKVGCFYLPGSVRQKAATCSPDASLGRYFFFWASVPANRMPWNSGQQSQRVSSSSPGLLSRIPGSSDMSS